MSGERPTRPEPGDRPEWALDLPAPAKLNLFLHVLGRRADGYHELESLMVPLDFGDRVRLAPRRDGRVRLVRPSAGVPEEQDLTVRAATALRRATRCPLGVDIEVEKRVPVGAGLGGGSSDAATTLLGLNRMWGLGLARERLMAMGLSLGADVPFFVFGRAAFARGVGERLRPLTVPAWRFLVLAPPVVVPTAEIFAAPELTRDTPSVKIAVFSVTYGRNDLQLASASRVTAVAGLLAWARGFGEARMTGSGGCVFLPVDSAEAARVVARQLPPGVRAFEARALSRHPLHDFAA